MQAERHGSRVAVVAGVRTPFAKAGTVLRELEALELARSCVAELMARTGLRSKAIDRVVFGQVIPSLEVFNIAREVVLGTELSPRTDAHSVSQACITSYQAVTQAAAAIASGEIECAIAGGAESVSHVPIAVSKSLGEALKAAARARTVRERLAAFTDVRPGDLMPKQPAVAEPSTGLTMGESAESMAKDNGIARADQDAFAHRSHTLAAKAWNEGKLENEVVPVYRPSGEVVRRDATVREDSKLEAYAKLEPAFDRHHGTITAGNSSPLTDGASAVVLMLEERARAEGLPVLGVLVAEAYGGVDPTDQLLIGPAYVGPRALARAGLELSDMTLVDLHEAFAAQVISVLQAWDSTNFARERLGRDRPVGEVDSDKLNVSGGSIALGHPFAATGTRQITQTLRELRRRGGGLALCSACAAGGLAAAFVLEAA